MTNHQITSIATMQVSGGLTAADLKQFASSVPAEARIAVNVQRGHQLDPDTTTITATWSGAVTAPGFQLPHSHIPGARAAR